MKSMHLLLDEAEDAWRSEISHNDSFSLWSDMPVVKTGKGTEGRDWEFSTDLRKVFALIWNDRGLQRKFDDVVSKYWDGDPEDLARETLHYLLFHELYHPLEAPFSVSGEDNDNKKIHQAIRRGIVQAEPELSPLDQVMKVCASQNGVKDFILDNRFALDNLELEYVREDIIPTWDLIELQSTPSKANFYTITRFMYGALYGPESTHDFFAKKAESKGVKLAEEALKELLQKEVQLPHKTGIIGKAKSLLKPKEDLKDQMLDYVQRIRDVFSGNERYRGIERFMAVLGPYVDKDMPKGRADQQGSGNGASPQNILQDLLEDMSQEEQQQFIQELAQEMTGDSSGDGVPKSVTEWENSTEDLNNLELFAIHEFYKLNHPNVKIVSQGKIGETEVIGKKQYFTLSRSTVITEDQLSKLNLDSIARFQKKTRLPMLIPLENNMYRLNEYVLKERELKDIVYSEISLDIPDVVELYLDSSGSMFDSESGAMEINDGSRWDMLANVVYGFVNALCQGSQILKKPCYLQIHNFANRQVSSPVISVEDFWNGNGDMLKVLFKPENGYNVEDINIVPVKDNKKRAYVVVTDGNLVIGGRTERESRKMKELAKSSQNEVVLFEIGSTYDLGNAVKSNPNIVYHQVHDKTRMLEAGLEVLLSK